MENKQRQKNEHLRTVESLFGEAIDLDGSQREAFLNARCGDNRELKRAVLQLIGQDHELDKSDFLEKSPSMHASVDEEHDAIIGQRCGAFTLRRHLGSGGMGHVYLGVRDDEYQQQVAVKVLRAGFVGVDVAKRFRKEMHFLAALGKHPKITGILDAGTTSEGQLYIAMEYVDGTPIDKYSDANGLSIRERLVLFCDACESVMFAHRNAILHRDLKPSNLLITEEGKPMLIDFGVAKLVSHDTVSQASLTQTFHHAFTPGYASPEQIENQPATTECDVYSLGVVLYELLSGTSPFDLSEKTLPETIKLVCESDPHRPSSRCTGDSAELRGVSSKRLRSELRGDLDQIVLKAIDRDVNRRYPTVEQFVADIRRFLDGKPVKAQPDALVYRFNKYVRRNVLAVVTASAVVLILLAAIGVSTRMAIIARRSATAEKKQAARAMLAARAEKKQRVVAEQQERNARRVIELFDRFMASADPRKTGDPDYPARQLLNEFAANFQSRRVEDPLVRGRLLQSMASALIGLGDYRSAELNAKKAESLYAEHLGHGHPSTLTAKLLVAQALLLDQGPGLARQVIRPVIALDRPERESDPNWNFIQFEALTCLAEAAALKGDLDEAESARQLAEEKISLIEASAKSEARGKIKRISVQLLVAKGEFDQALPLVLEDYEAAQQQFGMKDYRTAKAGDLLASIYFEQQRFDEAIDLYESSYRTSRQLFGDDRQDTLLRVMRLAETNYLAGKYSEADSWFRIYDPLYSALKRYPGTHHHELLLDWSECLQQIGKFDEAEELLHRCYSYYALVERDEQSEQCISIRRRMFALLRDTGREGLAEQWLVAPEAPEAIGTARLSVDAFGQVTLSGSRFVHSAGDMQHHATRWQIRAADETFEYSPTLDVTTTKNLERLTIPAGILLPNKEYFWRFAHIGQNRVCSKFSDENTLETGRLAYDLKPLDLRGYFNRDVVRSPGDESEDPFRPMKVQLVIDGDRQDRSGMVRTEPTAPATGGVSNNDASATPAATAVARPAASAVARPAASAVGSHYEVRGLPRNRVIGPHRLGEYQKHNAIQLDRVNDRVVIEVPPANLSSLRILVGAFLHGIRRHEDALKVTINYEDGTRSESRVHCPDWNLKIDCKDEKRGVLPANIVRNGMDSGFIAGGIEKDNNALFDAMIRVDPSRKLKSISLIAEDNGPLNGGARVNILAITGICPRIHHRGINH